MVSECSPRKLLVVDDEPLVRQTLSLCLRDEFEVTTAASGEEALELAGRESFPVVILDLCMQGLSGIETLKRLKAIRERQNVIILTAYESTDSAIAALNFGAFNYLTKPFERAHLKEVIVRGFEAYEEQDLRWREMQQRLMSVHDKFFSLLCHEFNTPLNSIIGFSQLLLQDVEDDERAEWIRDIGRSGEQLHAVLMEIVDYVSAAHLAEAEVNREFVPSVALSPLTRVLADRGVTLVYRDLIGPDRKVAGAEKAFGLIARKLASLAAAGSSRVRMTSMLTVDAKDGRDVLRLVVDETGVRPRGSDVADLECYFEPYAMAGSSAFPRSLGLELATCRKIIECARGEVRCAVRGDGELEFVVELPVSCAG